MEEELNKEKIDEDSLAKKVRSKKRIRGLSKQFLHKKISKDI